MESTEEDLLRKWNFRDELIELIISTKKLTESTTKRKAKALWDKYEPLIITSIADKNYKEKQVEKYKNIAKCLKSGFINTSDGCIRLDDVQSVFEDDERITLTMKSGNQLKLSKSFDFLFEVLTPSIYRF